MAGGVSAGITSKNQQVFVESHVGRGDSLH